MRDRVGMGWCFLRVKQTGAFKHKLKSILGRVEITCGIEGGPCFSGSTYILNWEVPI